MKRMWEIVELVGSIHSRDPERTPCPPLSIAPRSCKPGHPVQLLQLPFSKSEELHFVLVNPVFEAPTAEMRAVLPKEVPMKSMINNCCQGGSLVRATRASAYWSGKGSKFPDVVLFKIFV